MRATGLLLAMAFGWAGAACGAEFFVGREGNDANPGSRMQPFLTIGRAAEALAPGDVCTVSRGLYREVLRPGRSGTFEAPIRFQAATGETVTVSATEPMIDWQMYEGAVYRATSAPLAQVLIDDVPAARLSAFGPGAPDPAGAWVQEADGAVYIRLPRNDSPALHRIEAQRRAAGVDLSGLAHIEIRGFNVFGAGIALAGANHCRVEDCHVWWAGGDAAVVVGGKDNELLLTSIIGSAGVGLSFDAGSINNRVLNCLIRGTGTSLPAAVGLRATGTAQVLRQMTITDCAGGAIAASNLLNGRIEYCDIRHCGKGGADQPAVTMAGDGKGTVVAFNWIHDGASPEGDGIVLDAGSQNYIIQRNVIWGCRGRGLRLGRRACYSFIYNNTVALCGRALDSGAGGVAAEFKGLRIANNIFAGGTWTAEGGRPEGIEWGMNYEGGSPGFVDASNRNFRLAAGSPCIDAGQEEPEFTEGYTGERPDLGAYEAGGEDWVPGCRAAERANQVVKPSIRLVLDSSTPGAEIRYTLDGREPTADSALYTGAIPFVYGATVRARAFVRHMEPSQPSTLWVRQDE